MVFLVGVPTKERKWRAAVALWPHVMMMTRGPSRLTDTHRSMTHTTVMYSYYYLMAIDAKPKWLK